MSGVNACFVAVLATDKIENPNANLAPLASNGGFTDTHALMPDSDALDMGDNATCVAAHPAGADGRAQRGISRPQGTACDIGAFELQVASMPAAQTVPLFFLALLLMAGIVYGTKGRIDLSRQES